MYRVRRTRLDDKAPAAGRATADKRDILLDDRHITDTGAIALEAVLNALPPTAACSGASSKVSIVEPRAGHGVAAAKGPPDASRAAPSVCRGFGVA